jgi:hypothetical protein
MISGKAKEKFAQQTTTSRSGRQPAFLNLYGSTRAVRLTDDLKELIERVRQMEMTPDQLGEQRRSFAHGNTHIENNRITREMVAALDKKLHSDEQS